MSLLFILHSLKLNSLCMEKQKTVQPVCEWIEYGYTERRLKPSDGFRTGVTYPYPTGDTPDGANYLLCAIQIWLRKRSVKKRIIAVC